MLKRMLCIIIGIQCLTDAVKESKPMDKVEEFALFNPGRFFSRPEEILLNQKIELSQEQQVQVLKTWLYDVQLRCNAEGENMHSASHEADVALEQKLLEILQNLGISSS